MCGGDNRCFAMTSSSGFSFAKNLPVVIGAAAGALLVIVALVVGCLCLARRRAAGDLGATNDVNHIVMAPDAAMSSPTSIVSNPAAHDDPDAVF